MTKSPYNPVTPRIVRELEKIVGERYVIYADDDALRLGVNIFAYAVTH